MRFLKKVELAAGYLGLKRWEDSDNAASIIHNIQDAVVKALEKGIKEKDNEHNTGGTVNIALILEGGLLDKIFFHSPERLSDVAKESTEGLLKLIEKTEKEKDGWDSEKNRKYHLLSYKRLLKVAQKYAGRK